MDFLAAHSRRTDRHRGAPRGARAAIPGGVTIDDLFMRTDLAWPRGVQEEEPVHWRFERLTPPGIAARSAGCRSRSPFDAHRASEAYSSSSSAVREWNWRPFECTLRHDQRPARGVQRRRHRDHHHDHGPRAAAARGDRRSTPCGPLVPMFLSYVLSFAIVGIYWNNHHHLFQAVRVVERPGPVGEPAPAVLAVAAAVRRRPGWASTRSRRCPVAVYGVILLAAARRLLRPRPGAARGIQPRTHHWPRRSATTQGQGCRRPATRSRSRSRSSRRWWRSRSRLRGRDLDRARHPDRANARPLTRRANGPSVPLLHVAPAGRDYRRRGSAAANQRRAFPLKSPTN